MTAIICLATYNGARWLPQQLESIRAQDDPDWRLLVSDDGSTDGSVELLQRFAAQESRCRLLGDGDARRGACGNFEHLLHHARREPGCQQLLLCDQDDIWQPQKLRVQRATLADAAACCSELVTIDASGTPQGLLLQSQRSARTPTLSSLLAQNSVVGCTLALREEVLALALPFPPGLLNHDWWLALCAAATGAIEFVAEPLVSYRQHAGNEIGAFRPGKQLVRLPALIARQRAVLQSQQRACEELGRRLSVAGMESPAVLARYAQLHERRGALGRAGALLRGEFAAFYPPLRLLRVLAALR